MRENEGFIDMDFHFFLIYYIDVYANLNLGHMAH